MSKMKNVASCVKKAEMKVKEDIMSDTGSESDSDYDSNEIKLVDSDDEVDNIILVDDDKIPETQIEYTREEQHAMVLKRPSVYLGCSNARIKTSEAIWVLDKIKSDDETINKSADDFSTWLIKKKENNLFRGTISHFYRGYIKCD